MECHNIGTARKAVPVLRPRRSRDASTFKRAITTAYSFGLISEADAARYIRAFDLRAA
jgi:hypothetical protein